MAARGGLMGGGFRDHFSGHAAAYASARPGYPPELFAWLAANSRAHRLAWDAGCGNGQASSALAAHFDAVFATDPSAAQVASATVHPRVRYAVEPAERCSLADASANLVTVAQAYHWFDHAAFCEEARRVLKPGGLVALWSYARSAVTPAVDALFDRLHDTILAEDWPAGREHVIDHYRQLPFPFERIEAPDFAMHEHWRLAQYLAYLRSWSASQRHLARTGRDAVGELAEGFEAAWGDPEQRRVIRWPLVLKVGRAWVGRL
jgi:SAM-dependent methyltransferase